jgi:hypothetical protein
MGTPANAMTFPPPGVDPAQWAAYQRQQMIAQALTQTAITPPQEAATVGPIRSRLSPLQPVTNLVAALMARKAMDKSTQMGADVYGRALQQFGAPGQPEPSDAGAPPPSAASSAGSPPPAAPASVGPPPGAAPQMPPAASGGAPPEAAPMGGGGPGVGPAAGGGGSSPMNPVGLPPALAFQMWMKDPSKYGELIAGTPEWRNALQATNGNVPMAQRMLYAQLQKSGAIDLRASGEALIPDGRGGYTRIRNPNLPQGVEPVYGPNGEIRGASMIPGVPEAEETMSGAGARGKAENSINTLPTGVPGQTREQFGLGGIPGAPGAAGAPGGGTGRPVPQYFPPTGPSGAPGGGPGGPPGLPGGPTGGASGPDWWPGMPRVQNQEHIGYTAGDYQEKLADLRAKKAGDYITQFGLESDTADQKLEYSAELLRNLPQAFTGPQAQSATGFWNAVAQIPGIRDLPGIKDATHDAAGTNIAVKNLVNQAIQGARAIYGPRMAQSEVMLQKNEASPSITMGMQAILALQRQEDAKSAYFVQRKQDFDNFMAQGGDPLRFEGAYQHRFPLASFASQYAARNAPVYQVPKEVAPPAMVQHLVAHPETRNDFVARYGYLPPDVRQ